MVAGLKSERETINFTRAEVARIEGLVTDEDRKEVLAAMLAEKGLGTRALSRVNSFSDAARLLIQLSLWEVHRTEMAAAYRKTAEGMARLTNAVASGGLHEASVRAMEKALSRSPSDVPDS